MTRTVSPSLLSLTRTATSIKHGCQCFALLSCQPVATLSIISVLCSDLRSDTVCVTFSFPYSIDVVVNSYRISEWQSHLPSAIDKRQCQLQHHFLGATPLRSF